MINYLLILLCAIAFAFKIGLCVNSINDKKKVFGKAFICSAVAYMAVFSVMYAYSSVISVYYLQVIDFIASIAIIAFIDFKKRIIPNLQLILLLFTQVIYEGFIADSLQPGANIIISLMVLLMLTLISILTKEQFGMGDVKFMVVINFIYGLPFVAYTAILSLLTIILYSLPFLIRKKFNLKTQLPFAPFYLVGVVMYFILSKVLS